MPFTFCPAPGTVAGSGQETPQAHRRAAPGQDLLPTMSHTAIHSQIILNGRTFDLDHLAPSTLLCARPQSGQGGDIRIEVTFSHHTYTTKVASLTAATSHQVVQRGDRRFFDVDRWQQSRDYLPDMVAALPTARVEFTPEVRNYRYALGRLIAPGTQYALFFSLKRSPVPGFDLQMVVESAYPLPEGSRGRSPGHIRFVILADKILRGEAVSTPPRR